MNVQVWISNFPFREKDPDVIEPPHNVMGTLTIDEGPKYLKKLESYSESQTDDIFLIFNDKTRKMDFKMVVKFNDLFNELQKYNKNQINKT
jgi:hypothetical protein